MTWSELSTSFPWRRDRWLLWGLRAAAGICASVLLCIVVFVVLESLPALRTLGASRFLYDATWQPTLGSYGLAPMLIGSLAATLGSTLLTVPLGIAAALFLRVYAPAPAAVVYRRILEILAGIPSVVYGFWGLVVLVPMLAEVAPGGRGHSLLAGVLVLGLMTLPIVALSADAALAQVPRDQVHAAAALGLSRWTTVRHVLLPHAAGGIVSGSILQIGRAMGETMAVLMVTGNVVAAPDTIFAPIRTLTANIALEMGYSAEGHRSALFVCGLVLLVAVTGVVVVAHQHKRVRRRA
jgi:phosphate transport system permease protein